MTRVLSPLKEFVKYAMNTFSAVVHFDMQGFLLMSELNVCHSGRAQCSSSTNTLDSTADSISSEAVSPTGMLPDVPTIFFFVASTLGGSDGEVSVASLSSTRVSFSSVETIYTCSSIVTPSPDPLFTVVYCTLTLVGTSVIPPPSNCSKPFITTTTSSPEPL